MDLVLNLLEKYPHEMYELPEKQPEKQPTHEEVQEILDNADTGSSLPELARNMVVDIGAPMAGGAAAGAAWSKIASSKPAQEATRKALESLKSGTDDALGHMTSLIKKGTSNDSKIKKLMKQNEEAAKSVAEGGNGKKALKTVVKNSKREAEIGPRYVGDISEILKKDTGLSEKEVDKAIKKFMKEHAKEVELIDLIEAKDPLATYSHSLGVRDLSYKLAKKLGLPEEKAIQIADAALVHDIGKVQVPDSVISSVADFRKHPELENLKKWMDNHDIAGGEILLKSDPFKAKIARGHTVGHGLSEGSKEEGIVTVADLYEAMTSNMRSYKPGMPRDVAFNKIRNIVKDGDLAEEYYDLIKALYKDRLLKPQDSYEFRSPLESPYRSMKANEIKKQVASDYADKYFKEQAKEWIPFGAGAGAALGAFSGGGEDELAWTRGAKGGVTPTQLPSLSDIISIFSPSYKTKAEKLEDIKRWYSRGYYNDEIDKLIVDTDFKDNKQVTKLWKLMHDLSKK